MKKIPRALLLPTILIAIASANGPAASAGTYTLQDLEVLAARRDVNVEAQRERVEEAMSRLAESRSMYGPEFTSHYSRYPSGSNLAEEETSAQHWLSLGVRQDLIDLLKVRPARIREMAAGTKGEEAELREAEARALYDVRKGYLEMVEAKIRTRYTALLLSILNEQYNLQDRRYASQTSLLTDLLEAQRAVIEARGDLGNQREDFAVRRALLASSLDIEPDEIVVEEIDPPDSIPPEERLVDLALKNRGEIRRLLANAEMERARASLSAFDDIRLSSFLGYRWRDSGSTGVEGGVGVGITFTFPLQFKDLRGSRHDRFRAMESYWRLESERAVQEIKGEIHRAYSEYLRDKALLRSDEEAIKQARERLRIELLRSERPTVSIPSDPLAALQVKADLTSMEMESHVTRCRMALDYYKLLYLAGLQGTEDIRPGSAAEKVQLSATPGEDGTAAPAMER